MWPENTGNSEAASSYHNQGHVSVPDGDSKQAQVHNVRMAAYTGCEQGP